ncbi:hybrid sensor histidine kinase/response regulator [Phreatobacter stygius]|uniref:histidine kinase n=1 Tax=Phreatobacter stygius TaxID=1940610 RepID=A0A4D7AVD9_9HYPH|nr:PAS domain S-box protein [Phreatobacter stygius]QCI64899.1 PAS domain S-box protein [Phreatobacter stygius]
MVEPADISRTGDQRREIGRLFDDAVIAPHGRLDPSALARLFDAMPARVTAIDADRRYVYANKAALDLFNFKIEEIAGQTMHDLLGEAFAMQAEPLFADLTQGRARSWSDWIVYGDGQRRYVEQTYSPCMGADGQPIGYLAFLRDITDLKLREEGLEARVAALDAQETISSAIIATSIDPIVVVDEAGLVLDFNPAAVAVFGYARATAIGRPFSDLIVPSAPAGSGTTGMARYTEIWSGAGADQRAQVEAVTAKGRVFPVEMTVSEIRLAERRVFTAHIRDLTLTRQSEMQFAMQRERLHQAEKLSAMGSLLAGVAHELNNPLAILVAQSTLLVETSPSPESKRRAERIHAAAERAGRIVKSFLAMARQRPEKREPAKLNQLTEATVEMLGYGLRSHGIEAIPAFDGNLPDILADHDFLSQVIANLIINAQQALADQAGPRRIFLATRQDGGQVLLEVADNGPGVPPDLAQRIFEPYFTTKPAGVGTGIGLSICKTVVEAHGGTISLGMRDGGGARFTIALPTAGAEAWAEAHATPEAIGGFSILVIDDETDVRDSLAEMLELLGHRVLPAKTAAEALDGLAASAANLAFVDLRMPGMDGLSFRDALVARYPELARRVVIMTGDAVEGPGTIQRHAGTGEIPMLEKPFSIADVRRVLATME